jgi:hypothetical protein
LPTLIWSPGLFRFTFQIKNSALPGCKADPPTYFQSNAVILYNAINNRIHNPIIVVDIASHSPCGREPTGFYYHWKLSSTLLEKQ